MSSPRTARAQHVVQIDPATPERIQLLPSGKFSGRDGRGPYLNDQPEKVIAAFQGWGMPLLIDYHHQTLRAVESSGPTPAAGWGKTMETNDGEVWTSVEWTPRAAQSIQDRELLYISPVFDYEVATGRVIRIIQAALLNDPNLYLQAVAARSTNQMEDLMEKICYMLNLPVTSTADEVTTHLQRLIDQLQSDATATQSLRELAGLGESAPLTEIVSTMQQKLTDPPSPAEFVPRGEFEKVAQALAQVQQQQLAQKVQSLIDQGTQSGKLPPSMVEWGRRYATQDPEGFAGYLDKAPVLIETRQNAKSPSLSAEADLDDPQGFQNACQHEWDSNPAIRKEFSGFGAYHAYRKADAQGRVHIQGSK